VAVLTMAVEDTEVLVLPLHNAEEAVLIDSILLAFLASELNLALSE